MSKKSDEQTTPKWFFDILNDIFKFELDAAATKKNALCKKYYDIKSNGLKSSWPESTFCNPPYSRGQIRLWVIKANEEKCLNKNSSMLLLPRRHKYSLV